MVEERAARLAIDEALARGDFDEAIAVGLKDIDEGRVVPAEEVFERLRTNTARWSKTEMRNLRFSDAAERDLEEIGDYLAAENPVYAIRLLESVRQACGRIVETTEIDSKVHRISRLP